MFYNIQINLRKLNTQEAQLRQRDRMTYYVSNFMVCFTRYGS